METETKTITKETETKLITEDKYPIEDFIVNCEALGYRKEVAIGALFNCNEKELSKKEFKTLVNNFLNREVQ